ncbi:MAG: sce7726 family protein [Solobacterium sp.]|nr:sce7726 family protein [Solobacterium sp.]
MMLRDADIREPLFAYLENRFGVIRILEEKTMGKSRADVLMVKEDGLYGIEIKSDADTYARLKRQVRDYDRYYDYNYVVIGTTHVKHIEEHVPVYWGILVADKEGSEIDFYEYRAPVKNPKVKWKWKITVLWRIELAHIQERNHLAKYKQKSKKFVQEKVLEKLDEETLQKEFIHELFERDYQLIEEEIRLYKEHQ